MMVQTQKVLFQKIFLTMLFCMGYLISFGQPPACTITVNVTPSSGNQPSRVIVNNQVLCINGPGTYKGSIVVHNGGDVVICGGNVWVEGSVAIMPGGTYWRTPTSRIRGSMVVYGTTVNTHSNCASSEPEIKVEGNGSEIADGDASPSSGDHTDFGSAEVGGSTVQKTYTISNTGDADLTISGNITSSSGLFTVGQPSSTTIAASGSETFTVTFDPTTAVTSTSTITINNNDNDEDPYTFSVQGTGTIATRSSASSGNFNNAANWDCACIPAAGNDVVVSHDMNLDVSFSQSAARTFTVNSGKTLTINSGVKLEIAGNLVNNGAIDGDLSLNGSSAQTPTLGALSSLEINNNSGVNVSADISLSDKLTLSQGNLNLNGQTLTMEASSTNNSLIVQSNCGSAGVVGSVLLQQFVPETAFGHHYLSTPMTGVNLTEWEDDFGFKINDPVFPHLYYYDEANSDWTTPSASSDNIVVGRGYTGYFEADMVVDMTGTTGSLNCGGVTVPLTSDGDGWNLIGNPYPSPINWDNMSVPEGLASAIYLWDHIPAIWGRYATYIDGVGANGGNSIVPMMQGFFMHTTADVDLTFTNSHRVTDPSNSGSFLRTAAANNPLFRVSVTGSRGEIEAVVRFKDDALTSYEGHYDALLFPSGDPQGVELATVSSDDKNVVINTLPSDKMDHLIPVYLEARASGNYSIDLTQFDHFPTTSRLMLTDTKLGTTHDLSDAPYVFQAQANESTDRFTLNVQDLVLGVLAQDSSEDWVKVVANNELPQLLFSESLQQQGMVNVYSTTGELRNTWMIPVGSNQFTLPQVDDQVSLIFINIGHEHTVVKWLDTH